MSNTLHGNTDSQQPRYDAQSAYQAADYLECEAEQLESGIPEDQHEAQCRELEAIASGGEAEPDEVETMEFSDFTFPDSSKKSKYDLLELESQYAVNVILESYETVWKSGEKPSIDSFVNGVDDAIRDALIEEMEAIDEHYGSMADPIPESNLVDGDAKKHRPRFLGAIVQIPIQELWLPKHANTSPPMQINNVPLEIARLAAIALNERSIRRKRRSRAVIIRKRKGMYGVGRLAYVTSLNLDDPTADHPEIEFRFHNLNKIIEQTQRLNAEIFRVARCPKIWHATVVSIS